MTDEKEETSLREAARKALERKRAAQEAERPEGGAKIRGFERKATGKSRKTAKSK